MTSDFEWNEDILTYNSIKACVLVCGFTGTGKTTIAQRLCGRNIVPDSSIGNASQTTLDFVFYVGKQINIWDSKGYVPRDTYSSYESKLIDFAQKQNTEGNFCNCPQVVWICISGAGGRITEMDYHLVSTLNNKLPVVVIITKHESMRKPQVSSMLDNLLKKGIAKENITFISSVTLEGYQYLIDRTKQLLPEGQEKVKKLKDECFIATAVFQNAQHPTVCKYRYFRDNTLLKSKIGVWMIAQYYYYGPSWAKAVKSKKLLLYFVRLTLKLGSYCL